MGLWSLPRQQVSDTSPQAGVLGIIRLLQLRRHSSQWPKRSRLAGLLVKLGISTGHWVGRKQTNLWIRDESCENGGLTVV